MSIKRSVALAFTGLVFVMPLSAAEPSPGKTPRAALMEFSTDDNSYRSIQAAEDFTALVQAGLASEPGVTWVERAQINLARNEWTRSLAQAGGESLVHSGRMLGADWLVKGHFSTDDQEHPTLALQVIELEHADVLASDAVVLAKPGDSGGWFGGKQADIAVAALRRLLVEGRTKAAQAACKARVAFLFLAETSRFSIREQTGMLEQEFREALMREAAMNNRVRLIEFPKAYQSTEEAEGVVDGIIAVGDKAWKRTADLYVWGTYAVTNARSPNSMPMQKLALTMNFWDGASPPSVMNESLELSRGGALQPERASEVIQRMVARIAATKQIRTAEADSAAVRRQIASSIVKAYAGGSGRLGTPSPGGKAPLEQSVRMLETACLFDPDNADARVLWVTCRYGWWIDFTHDVKNEFWTKLRRSQAWGDYVERFGLKPPGVTLPFPYAQQGIPTSYLRSVEDALEMFPRNFDENEKAEFGPMKQAQLRGFPKDISNAIAAKWKAEVQTEYANRLTRVVAFIQSGEWTAPDKTPPRFLAELLRDILDGDQKPAVKLEWLEAIWPECVRCAKQFGSEWAIGAGAVGEERHAAIAKLCAAVGKPERAEVLWSMLPQAASAGLTNSIPSSASTGSNSAKPAANLNRMTSTAPNSPSFSARQPPSQSQMVPTPKWLDYFALSKLFQLYPPNIQPDGIKPEAERIEFPPRFEVKVVSQLDYRIGQLWILAMDEKSSPSTDAKPDLSGETLDERSRLWRIEGNGGKPTLYEPASLPPSVNAFLLQDDQLWLAGSSLSLWDMKQRTLRKFGLADGLGMRGIEAITRAGERIFVAGGSFELASGALPELRWTMLKRPEGRLSHGSSSSFILAGNGQALGYVAGELSFHDFATKTWTNISAAKEARSFAVGGTMFWIGADNGLHTYDSKTQETRSWNAPVFLESPFISMGFSSGVSGGATTPRRQVDDAENQILGRLYKLAMDGRHAREAALKDGKFGDPLQMNSRIPGRVKAVLKDGEFLWVGVDNYYGSQLLLVHKPSHSLVKRAAMEVRDEIASLAVSDKDIWAGTRYGDHPLLRFSKDAFLSVPKSQWVDLTLTAEERAALLKQTGARDQALYAFLAGDMQRVVQLLGSQNAEKASLEEMILLALSHAALGLNNSEQAERCFNRIMERHPNTPWERFARDQLAEHQLRLKPEKRAAANLARFDKNKDGKLDAGETRTMEAHPDFQREKAHDALEQLTFDLGFVIKRYDESGEGKLDRADLARIASSVKAQLAAQKEGIIARTNPVACLMTDHFPSIEDILSRHDRDKDGSLNLDELKSLALAIRAGD